MNVLNFAESLINEMKIKEPKKTITARRIIRNRILSLENERKKNER